MSEKKYSLTKPESDRIGNILSVARIQEEIMNAVSLSYKTFLVGEVFKRLGIDEKEFSNTAVNLQEGVMIVKEAEKPAKTIQKVEVKGVPTK